MSEIKLGDSGLEAILDDLDLGQLSCVLSYIADLITKKAEEC